jgi:hypothetical protein
LQSEEEEEDVPADGSLFSNAFPMHFQYFNQPPVLFFLFFNGETN